MDIARSYLTGQAGTWKGATLADSAVPSALMTCPNGHTVSLADHTILLVDADEDVATDTKGIVQPSVVCPEDGCNFKGYVDLIGWGDFIKENDNGS
jgi:hypothetical protein